MIKPPLQLRPVLLVAGLLASCSSDPGEGDGTSGRDGGSKGDMGTTNTPDTGSSDAEAEVPLVCSPNPCSESNRGVCSEADGEAVCSCDAGFVEDEGTCIAVDACDGCVAGEECVALGDPDPSQPCSVCGADGWTVADADYVCRPPTGECDAEELCDGTSLECPEDAYLPDEPGSSSCGVNGAGKLDRTCVAGAWEDTDVCNDPDECLNGDTRIGSTACGRFWSGGIAEDCAGGQWTATGQCVDDASDEILDVVPGAEGSFPNFIGSFQRNGRTITIFDPQVDNNPWATDGTAAGTEMLANFAASGGYTPAVVDLGTGEGLFVAGDAFASLRLFRTDGTAAGTTTVGNPDIAPRAPALWQGNGLGIFLQREAPSDNAVWASDGTDVGTVEILDKTDGEYSVWFADSFVAQGKTIFAAETPSGVTFLYCTDGTEAGTRAITSSPTFSRLRKEWNGKMYLSQRRVGEGLELVEVQDCAANVRETDINPNGDSSPSSFTPLDDDTMVFIANHVDYGYELWRMDAAGDVELVKDINPGTERSMLSAPVEVSGRALFIADDGVHGPELWVSDGTAAGTTMVVEIDTTDAGGQKIFAALGDRVIFSTPNAAGEEELWSSDGTAAGTMQLTSFGSTNPNVIGEGSRVGSVLFFTATDSLYGKELWVTTGVPMQVTRISDYGTGPLPGIVAHYPTPGYLFAIGHEVNSMYGREPLIFTP